ncbi:hypothetical protein L0Y46_03975 [bacterium]|nr:hypothetical protein [bacterium]
MLRTANGGSERLKISTIGLTRLDAIAGASEACDQAVFNIQRGSTRGKQQRNAPNA